MSDDSIFTTDDDPVTREVGTLSDSVITSSQYEVSSGDNICEFSQVESLKRGIARQLPPPPHNLLQRNSSLSFGYAFG
jgi:hypothetical protein